MATASWMRFNRLLLCPQSNLLYRIGRRTISTTESTRSSRYPKAPRAYQNNPFNSFIRPFSVESFDEEGGLGYPTAQLDVLMKNLSDFNRYERQSEISLIHLESLRQLIQLLKYDPNSRSKVWESGYVTELLKHRDVNPLEIQHLKNKALALLGHAPPFEGRGLRILSLDGGGIRGLIPILLLRHLEQVSGLKVDQMFDYVAGTSTGSIIASLLFINNSSLEVAESLYHDLSTKIFNMNNLLGLGQLFINQSFYDSARLEKHIRLGEAVEREMIDTAIEASVPKMCFVSTLVNRPVIEPFLFTNYQHHPSQQSNYRYRFNVTVWKAIMASTAAPGYFEEVNIEKYILQDGALLSNNPSAIALHEARLLWGNSKTPPPIQSLISLGTGRYITKSQEDEISFSTSLREKLTKIVASATDTEAVHTVLRDLLPPSAYFRFNPLLSDSVALDDAKPERLQLLVDDTMRYIEKNREEFERAADSLTQEKTVVQKAQEWYSEQLKRVIDWRI